jgi:hypothetical protein
MQPISDILNRKGIVADPHNKHEFQAYGNMLADKLGDPTHRTLYIRLAKEEDRRLVENALAFALDTEKRSGLGKLFMWKLKELQQARAHKEANL